MFGLGAGEILVIGVIALIFIGPKKLPELARGLGRGIKEFQKAKNELMDEVNTPDFSEEDEKLIQNANAAHQEAERKKNIHEEKASVVDSNTQSKDSNEA